MRTKITASAPSAISSRRSGTAAGSRIPASRDASRVRVASPGKNTSLPCAPAGGPTAADRNRLEAAGFPTAEGGVFRRRPAGLPTVLAAWVDFEVTGTQVSGDFRCADCGYGAVVHRDLPPCPMCGGTVWET